MRYLKKFDLFLEDFQLADAPAKPTTIPGVKPGKPAPARTTPIRRDKPAVEPAPKATADEVAHKFVTLAQAKKIDLKKELE